MAVRKSGLQSGPLAGPDDTLRLMAVVALLTLLVFAGALGALWTVLGR